MSFWRTRFCREGTSCLWEVTEGRGRKPLCDADKVAVIIEFSPDPRFLEKFTDVVGRYLNIPGEGLRSRSRRAKW